MSFYFEYSWLLITSSLMFLFVFYKLLKDKKRLEKLLEQSNENEKYMQMKYMQMEKDFALKEQELLLTQHNLETQLKESLFTIQTTTTNNQEQLCTLKQEYENKYKQQEEYLKTLHEKHIHELRAQQEIYDKKLLLCLQEQEQKINMQNMQKQDMLQELLHTERQKQESLMTQKFYELSNKLLEEKSKQFQEKQEISLKPLCDEIIRFKDEIAQNTKESREKQIALHTEIKHLRDTSLQVSKDANNLAHAMKGDTKKQGQWGEIILERLLEASGLQKDREYYTQFNIKNENNENLRPDVVIHLPQERFVVVDSKVSLNAYNRYCNQEEEREEQLHMYFENVKQHVKSLSAKNYHHYVDGRKLDFIIMFMPIEGAYSEILRTNISLFLESYQKGIIIAAPSTLMVVLRLIYHAWSNEAKDKNIEKILNECTKLVKKFENFTDNMEKVSRALAQAQSAYEKADTQLRGRGSMASYLRNIDSYMSQITYVPEEQKNQNTEQTDDIIYEDKQQLVFACT